MKFYKITLPSKVYVARGHCISMIANEFYEQFGFDDADDDNESNEFLAFEPLTKDYLTVKGENAVEALNKAFAEYRKQVEEVRVSAIKEYGAEEAEYYMDEEYGYKDLEETTLILEADNGEEWFGCEAEI